MDDPVLVYTTWPDVQSAEGAGRDLVEARLAACVNILPGMVSIYAWEGKIERAEECVMIVKTRVALQARVMDAVREAHPYEVPAVLAIPVAVADPAFAGWIRDETIGAGGA